MQRETWKFDYTAGKLAEAAQSKIAYHQGHLNLWKAKREELLVTIRSEGIEVDEKIVLAYSNPKARDWDRGGEIMIRNDLRKDLAECFQKLAYHTEQRDTYDGWKQVLEANPEDRVELDIDDWLFFFGRDVSRDQ
ncbi:MAG: hypothetical protein NT159_16325 [Proteobacteria bacterium]|jgi:hypothetical protein|nr:hypothetical protein [Pseudomonadota bacterium]